MGFYVKYPILQEIVGSLRQSIFEENLLDRNIVFAAPFGEYEDLETGEIVKADGCS